MLHFFIILFFATVNAFSVKNLNNLVNLHVITKYKIEHTVLTRTDTIYLKNVYPNEAATYKYFINKTDTSKPFSIHFFDEQFNPLRSKQAFAFTRIKLGKRLQQNETAKLNVQVKYLNGLVPAQERRKTTERQLMKIVKNLYYYSSYHTNLYELYFDINPQSVAEISHSMKSTQNGLYLKLDEVEYFKNKEFICVFSLPKPLLVVSDLNRVIYVSHLGFITITEHVFIRNFGAKVSDFSMEKSASTAYNFKTYLPSSATNIKLYDELGLLYFYNTKTVPNRTALLLAFSLRYPLKSGWKSNYNLQYNVPIYEYLYKRPENDFYVLKIRGIDHVLTDAMIENVHLQIILPELASEIRFSGNEQLKLEKVDRSWMGGPNIVGKPSLVFKTVNVDSQFDEVEVEYFFSKVYLYKTAFILILYVWFCYFAIILFRYLF